MNEATFLEAAKAFVPYGARIVSLGFSPELLGVHFAGHYSISFTDSFETFLDENEAEASLHLYLLLNTRTHRLPIRARRLDTLSSRKVHIVFLHERGQDVNRDLPTFLSEIRDYGFAFRSISIDAVMGLEVFC